MSFLNAMQHLGLMIDRFDKVTGYYVINPDDAEMVAGDLNRAFESASHISPSTSPANAIGRAWGTWIVGDDNCPTGLVIGVSDDKPVLSINDMLTIADQTNETPDKGRDGYAWTTAVQAPQSLGCLGSDPRS